MWTAERVINEKPSVRVAADGRDYLGVVTRVLTRENGKKKYVWVNFENDYVISTPQLVADALNKDEPIYP